MEFKRGFAKKSLARIITDAALTIGAMGLSLGLSCQKPNRIYQTKFQSEVQTQNKLSQKHQEYSYSKLENEVYDYVDKFSREIPKEFLKTANFYHDPKLVINKNFEIESGKGRLVYGYYPPETIVAGYGDKENFKLYDKTENPNILTNISFGRMLRKNDEIIILNKRNVHVIYLKKDSKWRKGVCEGSYYGFDPNCQNQIRDKEETVPQEQIQKYIDLSNRFKETYFKKNKSIFIKCFVFENQENL